MCSLRGYLFSMPSLQELWNLISQALPGYIRLILHKGKLVTCVSTQAPAQVAAWLNLLLIVCTGNSSNNSNNRCGSIWNRLYPYLKKMLMYVFIQIAFWDLQTHEFWMVFLIKHKKELPDIWLSCQISKDASSSSINCRVKYTCVRKDLVAFYICVSAQLMCLCAGAEPQNETQ